MPTAGSYSAAIDVSGTADTVIGPAPLTSASVPHHRVRHRLSRREDSDLRLVHGIPGLAVDVYVGTISPGGRVLNGAYLDYLASRTAGSYWLIVGDNAADEDMAKGSLKRG